MKESRKDESRWYRFRRLLIYTVGGAILGFGVHFAYIQLGST